MKKKQLIRTGKKTVVREINYIPIRYIFAFMITVYEVLAIIGAVVALCYFVPYFYIAAFLTQLGCVVSIIVSQDSADYKVPWLIVVFTIPIGGFMLYLIFYSRKLKKRLVRRLDSLKKHKCEKSCSLTLSALEETDKCAFSSSRLLVSTANAKIFSDTACRYFPSGELLMVALLEDLKKAESFIYMEYFIIEEGVFWNSILEILKEKASQGVEIKVLYDDIGCMSTLPGNYSKRLAKLGIEACQFSRIKGQADSEFNNRSHRKITVIDGKIGYTGGVNIADEYINQKSVHG